MIHSPLRYDRFLRLKVPPLLWLVMGYGLRHFVALFPIVRLAGGTGMELLNDWRLMASDVLVVLVLYAAGFRVPETGRLMREVWHRGREVLLLAYGLAMLVLMTTHWDHLSNVIDYRFPPLVALLTIDLAIFAYLFRSKLLRDVFADFPEAADREVKKIQPKTTSAAPDPVSAALNGEIVPGSGKIGNPQLDLQNPDQMMALAASRLSSSHPGEAEWIYRRLIELLPDFAPAWHDLGLLAVRFGKLKQAAPLVRQATVLNASNALYQRNLGEICRRLGRLAESINATQEAVRLLPDDTEAHYNLAIALADARRTKEAIAAYRRAIEIKPTHGQAWNNLGVLLRKQGNEAAARHAFEQALAIQPDHAEAIANLHAAEQGLHVDRF